MAKHIEISKAMMEKHPELATFLEEKCKKEPRKMSLWIVTALEKEMKREQKGKAKS